MIVSFLCMIKQRVYGLLRPDTDAIESDTGANIPHPLSKNNSNLSRLGSSFTMFVNVAKIIWRTSLLLALNL